MGRTLQIRSSIFGLAVSLLLGACATTPRHNESEHLASATLWVQGSAEYRALTYQTFYFAKIQLAKNLENRRSKKPAAIVADIDETLLDNSAYQAMLVRDRVSYPHRWDEFCNRAISTAVPGALEFLRFAHAKGVRIFYVTNRKAANQQGTIKNLRLLGFPEVTDERIFFRTDTPNKEPRRTQIRRKNDVVMLLGDNLNDFDSSYGETTIAERAEIVGRHKLHYGSRYVVLPNPMYGDWQGAVYNYNWALTPPQKSESRMSHLKGF